MKNKSKLIHTPLFTIYPQWVYNGKGGEKLEECKKTIRSEDEKKLITNRLSRIEGKIAGIKRMIEKDTYCNDVLIQLSAAQNSLKSLSNHILENHLYSCVYNELEKGNIEIIDELIGLFKRFNK